MNTSRLTAGASRFAHFAGLTRTRRSRRAAEGDDDRRDGDARAEEDEDDDRAEEDDDRDEPKGKRGRKARAEDDDRDDGDEDEPKDKRSRRAAEDDDDGEPDDADEPKGKRGRKARAEDDDDSDAEDDDKEEMTGKSASASARLRERARCAAIFAHRSAAENVPLAMSLAFETNMTRKEAIAVLKGQEGRGGDRAGGNHHTRPARAGLNRNLSSDTEPSGKQGTKSSWDATWAKVGVKLR